MNLKQIGNIDEIGFMLAFVKSLYEIDYFAT